ncbi:3-dehydroquinate synthase [Photobacterium sp. R1]
MDTFHRTGAGLLFYVVGVMALMILLFLLFEQDVQSFVTSTITFLSEKAPAGFWLISLFIIVLLTFDIVLPIPSSLVAMFAIASLGPLWGALNISIGLILSCCIGYWLGIRSDRLLGARWLSHRERQKARRLAGQLGGSTLVVMRGVPVLAETSVIAAGMIQYPFGKFLLMTSLANIGLATAYAYVGTYASVQDPFLLVVAGSIAVPALGWMLKWIWQQLADSASVSDAESDAASGEIQTIKAAFSVQHQYPVCFTRHVFARNNSDLLTILLRSRMNSGEDVLSLGCVLIVDQGVIDGNPEVLDEATQYFSQHQQYIHLMAEPFVVQGGEAIKQPEQLDILYRYLQRHQVDRHNMVIAMGGGALLDAVGYVCATFHRGIKLLRMPSTVLAQNDAGVGVKNGINAYGSKNLIGTFCPPFAVLNDLALLNTLPQRDKRAGLAEAVKVAAIRSAGFFQWLEQNVSALNAFDSRVTQHAIARCAELHIQQITQGGDPFETGNIRPLDYGHWAAHKLESLTQYDVRHGEAVAIGMALDAYYASEAGMLSRYDLRRLTGLLEKLGFTLWHPALDLCDQNGQPLIFEGLEEFRQHLGGQLCITLLTAIGTDDEVHDIDTGRLLFALRSLKQFHQPAEKQDEDQPRWQEVG